MSSNLVNKILTYAAVIGILSALVFVIFKQNEITKRQQEISASIVQQKTLLDNIERSGGGYATTADVEKFIKESGVDLKVIKEDLKKLGAVVNSSNVVVVNSNKGRTSEKNLDPSSTGPANPDSSKLPDSLTCPMCDQFGYLSKQQNLQITEKFDNVEVPFATVGFSAWLPKPFSLNVPQRTYKIVTVIGIDENNRSYYYNKVVLGVDGKDYAVKIDKAETKQVAPTAKMSWWNPHLFLNVGGGYAFPVSGNVNAGVSLGISSYGKFKTTPDLSLFQVGVGYDVASKRPQVSLAPINVNVGNLLKSRLISNTYVGPAVSLNTIGTISVGAQLSIGF